MFIEKCFAKQKKWKSFSYQTLLIAMNLRTIYSKDSRKEKAIFEKCSLFFCYLVQKYFIIRMGEMINCAKDEGESINFIKWFLETIP